jgi:glycosyltransferase involved in cell wall biosynthesis
MPVCYQVNLQTRPGGGEIFTRCFAEALATLGWDNVLVVSEGAHFWHGMALPARLVALREGDLLAQVLPGDGSVVLTHNVLGEALARRVAARHTLAGIVHMPFHGREAAGLPCYARIFAVSEHVRESLAALGLSARLYREPLHGMADLRPRDPARSGAITAGSVYDWDRRKFRDRALAACQPLAAAFARERRFSRRPGTTLGIVSRLTPIKQFPLLFSLLAPGFARRPTVNLEIFGSGGYASVRDLRRALEPMRGQARLWGQQSDVAAVYGEMDYVLSGLPEKEALGLNLLEAQISGTPVLAVNAPPFTETVLDGVTGHLFEDPRRDGGQAFAALLDRILAGEAVLDRGRAAQHLARFSRAAFTQRVERAMQAIAPAGRGSAA